MVNEKEDFHQRSGFNLTEVKFRIRMSIRILNSKSWTLEAGWGPEFNLSEIKTGRRLGGACVDITSRLVGDRSWIWIDLVLISVRLFTVWSNLKKCGKCSVWMFIKRKVTVSYWYSHSSKNIGYVQHLLVLDVVELELELLPAVFQRSIALIANRFFHAHCFPVIEIATSAMVSIVPYGFDINLVSRAVRILSDIGYNIPFKNVCHILNMRKMLRM